MFSVEIVLDSYRADIPKAAHFKTTNSGKQLSDLSISLELVVTSALAVLVRLSTLSQANAV